MKSKIESIWLTAVMGIFLVVMTLLCFFAPKKEYSDTERRVLASFPKVDMEQILSGKFMSEFESYSLDQFPGRDFLRSVKAGSSYYVFQKRDNNKLYRVNQIISKIEYPMNMTMIHHAAKKFESLYEDFMEGTNVKTYVSVVPDKNYFLAEKNGYLSMDYDTLYEEIEKNTPSFEFIDLRDVLSLEDYYLTDTHWKQECLQDVVKRLSEHMGFSVNGEYTVNRLEKPFYGVYAGQFAMPVKPDTLTYLTSDIINQCKVTSYASGRPKKSVMYNLEKGNGKDPYEIFLSGSEPFLVIENPNATTDKELIIFRDSFGSSLSPLLVEGYAKVTIVDIRYMQSKMLGNLIKFDDQDVLFIYSALVLNNSTSLR